MSELRRGAVAGLAGTVVLSVLSAGETRWRGRAAVYEPATMVARLAQSRLHVKLPADQRRWAGVAMRWPYGAAWGTALGALAGRRLSRAWPLWGLALGVSVLGFELLALPRAGATPPLSEWRSDEIAIDALNTLVFGLTCALTLREIIQRTEVER
ncbi:MAG: hypothetical protein ACREQM_00385 [Candidatus Dormibacteraceae bacterium]